MEITFETSSPRLPARGRLAGEAIEPRPAGTLWVPSLGLMAVADLHLGKAERMARRGGTLLPPFETRETLERLAREIAALDPAVVVCVGDSLDDDAAVGGLDGACRERLGALVSTRRWIWVSGNHDPAPSRLGGEAVAAWRVEGLVFRHIAAPGARGEISGHYHPKATICLRGRRLRRRCFLADADRWILPAFGTYTGGLDATAPVFDTLLAPNATAWLLGERATPVPRAALVPR
jgi:DNA ligase-associated metallophosphoesterase